MPATFLYLIAFGGWLCLAVLVWAASACLLILPATRRFAGPLASAMAFTFPGVFAFQLMTLPVGAAVLGTALVSIRLIDPSGGSGTDNPAVIGIALALVLAEFLLVGAMSLLGFYEGWRAGWLVAQGRGFGGVIAHGPTARILRVLGLRRQPERQ